VRPGGSEDHVVDEPRSRLPAIEPGAERRHREPDVLGHQPDEGPDIGELPGADVAFAELLDARVRDIRYRRSQAGLHGLAGPGKQAVDC
jgi:hypothetical protein